MKKKLTPLPWVETLHKQLSNIYESMNSIITDIQFTLCEHKKESLRLHQENKELQHNINLNQHIITTQNLTIAHFYQDMENKNAKLSECLNTIRMIYENDSRDEAYTCECCCEKIEVHNILRCTSNHILCKECINKQCHQHNLSIKAPVNFLKCCSIHICEGTINEETIYKTNEGKKMIREYHIHEFLPIVDSYYKNCTVLNIEKSLPFLKSDGKFRAFQCPKCEYGPILHQHCDDLQSHHGQQVNESSFVNNACPSCEYLCDDVHDLVQWNGR